VWAAATGGPGVVRMLCVVLWRTSQCLSVDFVSPENSSRRPSGSVPPATILTLETDGGAIEPGLYGDVTLKSR
jgi:hypothetical protein